MFTLYYYFNNYLLFVVLFFLFFCLLSFILFIVSYLVIYQENYLEKVSSYECGFEPFEDTRIKFDVRFYLVAILFIIFDIEIMFLMPWVAVLGNHTLVGFLSMFFFLFILTVGFIYE